MWIKHKNKAETRILVVKSNLFLKTAAVTKLLY